MKTITQLELFANKFVINNKGCWVWQGAIQAGGYGQVNRNSKVYLAHRWGYMAIRGDIPDGLDLDHLCRNRACVNPYHLEPVTRLVNIHRGLTTSGLRKRPTPRTHCRKRHEFTPENTYVYEKGSRHFRSCRTCESQRGKQRWQLFKQKILTPGKDISDV